MEELGPGSWVVYARDFGDDDGVCAGELGGFFVDGVEEFGADGIFLFFRDGAGEG